MKSSLFLFFCLIGSLFGESTGVLFYIQDAGETYALLPVARKLEEKGVEYLLLVAGVAEEAVAKSGLPPSRVRKFQDFGIEEKIDRSWTRQQTLPPEQIDKIAEQIQPKKVVAGVAYELQGQLLYAFKNRGIPTFAYWDNFSFDGENPYFQTAHHVEANAQYLLLPSHQLKEGFCFREGAFVVGQPTLEEWRKELEAVDAEAIRKKLGTEQKIALFIGGYGPEYEEAFQLFVSAAPSTCDILYLFQPHPKMKGMKVEAPAIRVLDGEISTVEGVAVADLVICHQSTVAYQALAAGKPVLHIIPENQTFDSIPLQLGFAQRVSQKKQFAAKIHQTMGTVVANFTQVLGIPSDSAERCAALLLEEAVNTP